MSLLEKSGIGLVLLWVLSEIYFAMEYGARFGLEDSGLLLLGVLFVGIGYSTRKTQGKGI